MSTRQIIYWIGIALLSTVSMSSCKDDDSDTPYEVPFKKVNGFIIDNEGTKLLATDKGLFSLNATNGEYVKVTSGIDLSPLNDVSLFQTSSSHDLWLASNEGALNVTKQSLITSSNSGLHNSVVKRLNFDNQERSYFATPNGISILDNETWIKNLGQGDLYLKYEITDIASATNGYTYVTTNGGGVERFKLDVDGVSGATIFDTDWTLLESNTVLTVFIDDTVQAYGTDKGAAIHYSEYTKWNWETFTTVEGLINDTVLSIVKDHSNNWWFGTMQGLSKYDGIAWTDYSVETHSLISNKIKFLAVDIDGSLWFASDLGVSHFMNDQWTNY